MPLYIVNNANRQVLNDEDGVDEYVNNSDDDKGTESDDAWYHENE